MANMQPTRSVKYATDGTAEGSFAALRAQFAASTHWEVQHQTADTGFVVRATGGTDTVSQFFFARSSNNVTMRIEPTGSITDGSGTGISSMASPESSAYAFNAPHWQFHEWVDAFMILRCDYSDSIVDYPWGLHAGLIHSPSLAPSNGLTGLGYLSGSPQANNGAWFSTSTGNSCRIRVDETGVEATDWAMNLSGNTDFYVSDTNGNLVGSRDQPESMICAAFLGTGTYRKIGFFKYCFSRSPAQTPGVCQFVDGVRKMQHVGPLNSSSYQLVVGIEDGFQPAGAPT